MACELGSSLSGCPRRTFLCQAKYPQEEGVNPFALTASTDPDKKLKSIWFIQLTMSPCLFIWGSSIYVLYTDDPILMGPLKSSYSLLNTWRQLDWSSLLMVPSLTSYTISKDNSGNIHLTQHLAHQYYLERAEPARPKCQGQISSSCIQQTTPFAQWCSTFWWLFLLSSIGKLNYLRKWASPNISVFAHIKCAWFSANAW